MPLPSLSSDRHANNCEELNEFVTKDQKALNFTTAWDENDLDIDAVNARCELSLQPITRHTCSCNHCKSAIKPHIQLHTVVAAARCGKESAPNFALWWGQR